MSGHLIVSGSGNISIRICNVCQVQRGLDGLEITGVGGCDIVVCALGLVAERLMMMLSGLRAFRKQAKSLSHFGRFKKRLRYQSQGGG